MNEPTHFEINSKGFPDPLEKDKASFSFGLSVGQAIQSEWFRRFDNTTCRYYSARAEFHRRRLYARGEQPIQKYKDEIAIDGDLSFVNMDWSVVPIIPKFVDIVVNGMQERLYDINADAVDDIATTTRKNHFMQIEKEMVAKDILLEAQEKLGINAFINDPKQLPENKEEFEVYKNLGYKQPIEIAQEQLIEQIFKYNRYEIAYRKMVYDMVSLGIGFCKHSYNNQEGIRLEYVDPMDMVYSFSEHEDFEDAYYFGELKRIPISELSKIDPSLTNEDLEKIKANAVNWRNYHDIDNVQYEGMDDHVVPVLFFTYKTFEEDVYKVKVNARGNKKIIPKDKDWNPPKEKLRDSERYVERYDVWYEGAMVLGTDYILQWELAKDMLRTDGANQRLLPKYIGYAPRFYNGRIDSLVSRMIPFGDMIQLTHLKMQQVTQRIVPDGIYLDVDGLNEIDFGDGSMYNVKNALSLYFQTGSVVGRSYTQDGEYNHGKIPIQELNHNSGQNKIRALIDSYNYNLDRIRDVTGINEVRDGSTPSSEMLVGVQKMAALNSNTATRHILDACIHITECMAESINYRLCNVLEDSKKRKALIDAIGSVDVDILEDIKKIPLHQFGIYLTLRPDHQERQEMEANIQQALARENIYLEDAIDIRNISNIKLANQLLKVRRRKKFKEDMERQEMNSKVQQESAVVAAQAKSKAEIEKINAETQATQQTENLRMEKEKEKLRFEANLKMELMDREFMYNMALKGKENEGKTIVEEIKSKNKVNEGKPTKQFESSNDNMGDFGMEAFGPK